jgi:hypothetical protein
MPLPAIAALLLKLGAPLLANAAVAKGKEWVEEKTGVKLDQAALSGALSPDDATRLRQYELENEVELAELRVEDNRIGAELDKAYLADRQDARARDVEFIKQGRKNERADNLAYLAVGGFLTVVFMLFVAPSLFGFKMDQDTKEILLYILGVLQTIVVMVYAFDFGTSKDAAKMGNAMTKWLDEGDK